MARRDISRYVCQSCGAIHQRWAGRCNACQAWNSIVQEPRSQGIGGHLASVPEKSAQIIEFSSISSNRTRQTRLSSGNDELNRTLGGGFVPGSVVLLGGEPGIGKSTLLMQVAASMAQYGHEIVYISGEEAVDQIAERAVRLQLGDAPVRLAAESSLTAIVSTLEARSQSPALIIIDSIQTIWAEGIEASPGTVTQVRYATQNLIRYAKNSNASVVLVGHVTKEGQVAGPKVLEHMVDAVLYFESDHHHQYRVVRTVKNRFGASDEIGVFEMTGTGLLPVGNPSATFLAERERGLPGSAVFAGIEGSRPILVEIQALVSPTNFSNPKRSVVGWDQNRLSMITAVLETKCGLHLSANDIYLNVAGGMKISDPAADLAVSAALISSLLNKPADAQRVFFGEVGLSGGLRAVPRANLRLREAKKLGFSGALVPEGNVSDWPVNNSFELVPLARIEALPQEFEKKL